MSVGMKMNLYSDGSNERLMVNEAAFVAVDIQLMYPMCMQA